MPTFNDMVNEVRSNLQGYTLRQDRLTYLANTGGITASGTEIEVGSSNNLAKGIIEIDDELIWIDSFNKATSTMNVIQGGFGRGYQGTQAVDHAQNALVILSPTFPRQSIKRAINDTINSFFPKLWGVGSTTFTFNASQTAYTLPAEAESVIFASWQTTGSSLEWLPINRWRMDPMANFNTFGTNNTINIYENIQPGRTVQVFYTKEPTVLTENGDDFVTTTGLPASAYDVVILGASYKLLSFLDPGRINLTSAEADLNDSKIPSNAGVGASRYIYALYQQRLNEEALKLQDKFPIRIHYTK
jgi:hypothetical protein